MKEFKLEFDFNTLPVLGIRYIGTLMLGILIGMSILQVMNADPVNWISLFGGASAAFMFSVFPGKIKSYSITMNEDGIFTNNYRNLFESQQIDWDKVRSIQIKKSTFFSSGYIHITKTIGSTEKIFLPMHSKQQFEEFVDFTKQLVQEKEIEYIPG